MINLPSVIKSGAGAIGAAKAIFGGPGGADDWRVRLSLPKDFESSSVLSPIKQANGLVFPFTPQISINSTANYDEVNLTHQNYQFLSYQSSRVESITIAGTFVSEDATQAQYWVAMLHFLRAATKMYSGMSTNAGSPPPILSLNGYGSYVFKNVPVVVKSFSIDLPADVDYIGTSVGGMGGTLGEIGNTLGMIGSIAGGLGASKVASALGKGAAIAGTGVGLVNKIAGLFGSESELTYVPVNSSISVTVQPIYSRDRMRTFSLNDFVNGKYVSNGGYV